MLKRAFWVGAFLLSGCLAGCHQQGQSAAYNPKYDGLSGQTIPPVNLSILKDQAELASKYAVNASSGSSTGASQ